MRTAIVTRNAFNKSQNQINIQCGVLVREAKRVQSLFSKEFLALVVNACIAKAGKKNQRFFSGLAKFQSRSNEKDLTNVMCLQMDLTRTQLGEFFFEKTCFKNISMLK